MLKRKKTAVALATGAMALGLLGAAPVAATTTTGHAPAMKTWEDDWNVSQRGVVIAKPGVLIRSQPTTASHEKGFIPRGEIVWIECKVEGQDVFGNSLWYKIGSHNGFVAARWVKNVDHIPFC
ncbi:SH3 domain-containing protein [Streptomyces sp. NBC_01808]|uniref:SH3 domain-containing protein n=1 Tax=Streptomyces sp. NBC_01808 TaxID=2975947 RepID=UPI002DDA9EA8|nr:SH3 domain-containing protein [Streptomyces sp. NBC_01808]WSA38473.1 SH3 domain-containing protein [Streptomyces sp. NBC_01808]